MLSGASGSIDSVTLVLLYLVVLILVAVVLFGLGSVLFGRGEPLPPLPRATPPPYCRPPASPASTSTLSSSPRRCAATRPAKSTGCSTDLVRSSTCCAASWRRCV